jgi:hypothetical protein
MTIGFLRPSDATSALPAKAETRVGAGGMMLFIFEAEMES